MSTTDPIPQSASTLPHSKLLVLSGPSGVGKSTVLRSLVARHPDQLRLSISATTRHPRPGERDGVDYYFLDSAEFDRRRQAGEFLECCEVFGRGHWYGTLLSEVRPSPTDEKWVILDIDVDGAEKVRNRFPGVSTIFLQPNSEQELAPPPAGPRHGIRSGNRSAAEVAQRELARGDQYKYQVVNETVERAVDEIDKILTQLGIVST